MKANAPERIWIDPTNDLSKLSGHIDKDGVEYIRTDVFIMKVETFICDHINSSVLHINSILKELENYIKR